MEVVIEKLMAMQLKDAAAKDSESVEETLSFYNFPAQHWRRIRTNNPLECIMREIRQRTRVVAFPDRHSALMLTAARLRHIAGTQWGQKRYILKDLDDLETHVA